jgi:oligosaccharide repeat unit polymerase
MWPIIVIVIMLVIMSLMVSKAIHNDYFSPPGILAVSWLLPALTTFKDDVWNLEYPFWLFVVIGSYLSFLCGYFICFSLFKGKKKIIKENQGAAGWDWPTLEKIIYLLFIMGMIGFINNIIKVIRAGGLVLYMNLGFRQAEYIFGASTWSNYLFFLNMLTVSLSLFYIARRKKKSSMIIIFITSYISLFFHGIKATVLIPTIMAAWIIILSSRKFKWRYILVPLFIGFLVFQLGFIGRDYIYYSKVGFDKAYNRNIDMFFNYIAPNYANLQKQVNILTDLSYGFYSFTPFREFYNYFGNKRAPAWAGESIKNRGSSVSGDTSLLVSTSYNVATYLYHIHRDFGFWGIYLLPFILGIITALIYFTFLKNPTIKNLIIYSIVATMLTLAFFSNEFIRIQLWFLILVVVLIDLMVKVKRTKPDERA